LLAIAAHTAIQQKEWYDCCKYICIAISKNILTVYFISGQAADEQLFENLTMPSSIQIKHVHWIEPLKNESLADYTKRLSQQINPTESFALVGVSLGGIVAVELNKILSPRLTVIISSIATLKERPAHFRFFNFFKLQKMIPGRFYKWYNPFVNWYFGAETKREKELLRYYMNNATANYMKWATNEVVNWKNEDRPANLFHIHGSSDKIFLHRFANPDHTIEKAGHLMVHNRAEEISRILAEQLNRITQ
jgi:hypothetical protein